MSALAFEVVSTTTGRAREFTALVEVVQSVLAIGSPVDGGRHGSRFEDFGDHQDGRCRGHWLMVGTPSGCRGRPFRRCSWCTSGRVPARLCPENEALRSLSEETRLVVSEPLGDLRGAWVPVPESAFGVIQKGDDDLGAFHPAAP